MSSPMSSEHTPAGDFWGFASWLMFGVAILWAAFCFLQIRSIQTSPGSDYMGANTLPWLVKGVIGCMVATLMGIARVGMSVATRRSLTLANRWALALNGVVFCTLAVFLFR
jgi:hypothetical protein